MAGKKPLKRPVGRPRSSGNGQIVNKLKLGQILGIARITVDAWLQKGMPYEERPAAKGGEWKFNTAKVIDWIKNEAIAKQADSLSNIDFEEARRRKIAAEASMAEIELAEKKKQVVEVEMVGKVWDARIIVTRQRLRGLGARLAPFLVGEEDKQVIQDQIDEEIDNALRELADIAITEGDILGGLEQPSGKK